MTGKITIIKGEEQTKEGAVKADDFLSQMSSFAASVTFDIEATVSKKRCVQGAAGAQCGLTLVGRWVLLHPRLSQVDPRLTPG